MQKKAIRIINGAPYNSHTEPLFKNNSILPVDLLVKYFKLLFMYDYCHNLLPLSFKNLWPTNAERRNQENPAYNNRILRDDNLLHVPFSRLEHYRKFPLVDYPHTWNDFTSLNAIVTPTVVEICSKIRLKNFCYLIYPNPLLVIVFSALFAI
jgi:hypothetical protein